MLRGARPHQHGNDGVTLEPGNRILRYRPIVFWYRQSPGFLEPVLLDWQVDGTDPSRNAPGAATVVLDPEGRLFDLEIGIFSVYLLRCRCTRSSTSRTSCCPRSFPGRRGHASNGMPGLMIIFAIVGYAFVISLGGRPIFQKSILPE